MDVESVLESEGTVSLRQFTPGDAESVTRIENAWIRHLTPLSLISRYYAIPPEGFIVAEVSGRVVGFVAANVMVTEDGGKAVHILSVAVDPGYTKRGIGRALMDRIVDALRGKGVNRVVLEVRAGNRGAREFYRRLGFREVYIAKHYYRMRGYTEDAVIMAKSLAPREGGVKDA